MTRLVRSPSALYQRVARASRTALSWMTNASAPEPQTSSGCGSDTLTSWKDPVQIVPAPTGLQTRKSGGGGLRSSGAGGAAEAPPANTIEPTMANPTANPSVRASLIFPPLRELPIESSPHAERLVNLKSTASGFRPRPLASRDTPPLDTWCQEP